MHDQGRIIILLLINEVIIRLFGLELKFLGISVTAYCVITGQIPIKTHFSLTFSSRISTDSGTIKSVRVGGKN